MGDDRRIVDAARVSYGRGTRSLREDGQLIDYLLRHDHTSPFEQVVFTFQLKMPIFVARQWIRGRPASFCFPKATRACGRCLRQGRAYEECEGLWAWVWRVSGGRLSGSELDVGRWTWIVWFRRLRRAV